MPDTQKPADNESAAPTATPAAQEPPFAKKPARKSGKKKAPVIEPAPALSTPPTVSAVTKSMLSKLERAYKKAEMPDVTEAKKVEFAEALLAARVSILNISSGRIARAIKGEITIEDLKMSRRAKA